MKYSRQANNFLRTAMLMTVLMVIGHIHSHLCLDGQERGVSVHFETFSGHHDQDEDHLNVADHDAEVAADQHQDVENELVPQGLLASKAPDQGSPALLLAFSLLFDVQPSPRQLDYQRRDELNQPPPTPLFPPQQGPPAYS